MSFGFGVGDFLVAFELATKVRDRWTDAPQEYKSIKDETKNVENILRDVGELGTRMDLSKQREADLKQACQPCRELMEECNTLVDKYSTVQNMSGRFKARRAWARLQVDSNDIRHLRERLSAQITQLSLLYDAIENDMVIEVSKGVQDLQHNDAQWERTVVADWYSPTDFADQQTDQLARRQPGTGGWFLTSSEYQHWRQQANSTLLCPGIPGSGKSVMAATIIDDLQTYFQASKDIVVIYIYCNFNRQAEQDLRRMLATLTRQLFQEKLQLPDAVATLYEKHRDRATRPSVDELKNVLRLLVNSYRRAFVVIDALDECANTEQQRDQLLDELFSLQKSNSNNTNVLVTTRFVPDIVQQFSKHPKIEIRAHKSDIQVYLANRMTRLAKFVSQDIQLQQEIQRRIVDAAEGMFLLARLQFESLRDKTNRGHMREALFRLEKGSDALHAEYDKAIERIQRQLPGWYNLAQRVFMWITYANRQLSIDELREAIAIDPEREGSDLADYLDDEDQIVSVCHGLVEVDQKSQVVRLVHYTTQEYMKKIREQWLPEGNSTIAQSCIAYLRMDVFAHNRCRWGMDLSPIMEQHKFLEYAGENWGIHSQAVQSEELLANITGFLSNSDYLRFSAMIAFKHRGNYDAGPRYRSTISAMHISSYFGLYRVLQNLIQRGEDINCTDGEMETPLCYAARQGHTETVRLLLAQPGIDVNAMNPYGFTPLSEATIEGHSEVVQLLLAQPGIEVNAEETILGLAPLSYAALHGHTEVVRLLLAQPGIALNAKDKAGVTPLFYATRKGNTEVIQLLLSQPGIETIEDSTPAAEPE